MVALNISLHAQGRTQQRGLRREVLQFLLEYGEMKLGAGALWCFLREDRLPTYLQDNKIVEQARRWVLVFSEDGRTFVTAYARADASKHATRKSQQPRNRYGDKQPW